MLSQKIMNILNILMKNFFIYQKTNSENELSLSWYSKNYVQFQLESKDYKVGRDLDII